MKELSELAMKRRIMRLKIGERAAEIKVAQNEYDRSTSTKHKQVLLQHIDKLTNQPLHEY